MIGYGSEENHFVFELTYNYGIRSYKQGNDLHAIILNGRQAIHDNCIKHNYPFIVENNNLILKSPDNYTFFIQEGDLNVMGIEINVNHLDKSLDYYVDVLGMSITSQSTHSATVQFSKFHTYLVLREKKEVIEFGESSGRLAIGMA